MAKVVGVMLLEMLGCRDVARAVAFAGSITWGPILSEVLFRLKKKSL